MDSLSWLQVAEGLLALSLLQWSGRWLLRKCTPLDPFSYCEQCACTYESDDYDAPSLCEACLQDELDKEELASQTQKEGPIAPPRIQSGVKKSIEYSVPLKTSKKAPSALAHRISSIVEQWKDEVGSVRRSAHRAGEWHL